MFPSRPVTFSDDQLELIIYFCYPIDPNNNTSKLPSHLPFNSFILTGLVFYFNKGKNISVALVGHQYHRSYPFCVCIISDCPDVSSHFSFLSEIVDTIVSKSILKAQTAVVIPETLQNITGN